MSHLRESLPDPLETCRQDRFDFSGRVAYPGPVVERPARIGDAPPRHRTIRIGLNGLVKKQATASS